MVLYRLKRSRGVCTTVHFCRCREHAVWTLVSATCSLHMAVAHSIAAYSVWSGYSPCAYADASPGVGSLVGREFAQSLGARLLVSVLHGAGATRNLYYILFYTHDNLMKVYNVLFSTVINATVLL